MPIIETTGLDKSFGTMRAVRDLSIRVERGEIFGFLGPNGAGKSTTVRMLTTLLAPTAGAARICGFDLQRETQKIRERIGYVSQEVIADNYLTARENLRVAAGLYHLPRDQQDVRIAEMLELAGLEKRADERVKNLSGGLKKRLDIVCGLIHTPHLLFLDEPTLGLDVESRLRVWQHIRDLREMGVTIFLCTNLMDEADKLCDRLAIIDDGVVRTMGTPDALKDQVGGEVITLTLPEQANGLPDFRTLLQKQDWVHKVQVSGRSWEVYVAVGSEALPPLMELAHGRQIRFDRVSMGRLSLDDVFLSVVGHRMDKDRKF